jgi:inosine-uridine nucleoside N-ribohydrolase
MLVILLVVPLQAAPAPQKILFDCDLGGDIDDAFALALILTSPEFEVLGITLDHGLTEKRAQVACQMLYHLGLEKIPVAVGRQTPNVAGKDKLPGPYSAQFYWAEGFSKIKPIATPASDFIIQTLRKYPNEVILFTVGPVPNIADVIQKDPGALKLAKKIYSMFGSFYLGYGSNPVPSAEWNVVADVASSKAFVEAGIPITYAGLDITTFVTFEEKMRVKLFQRHSPLTDALSGLYTLWSNETGYDTPVLFDAVAVAMALWPDLFQTRPAHVKVTDGGYTVLDEGKTPNGEVGMTVNKDEFLRRVMKRWLQQNLGRP